MSRLRILLAAAEVAPLVSVGGVAEYLLGLASALRRQGHDVRVMVPAYGYLSGRPGIEPLPCTLKVRLGFGIEESWRAYEASVDCPGGKGERFVVNLLGDCRHFEDVRSPQDVYYAPTSHVPWIAFSRAVIDFIESIDWKPDVIHCHDAHTALVPVYVKDLRCQSGDNFAKNARTVLTIHNLLNQGIGDPGLVSFAGLSWGWFNVGAFEFYGQASCFKAGLLNADAVNAVSQTYAREISTSGHFGFGLESVLRSLSAQGRLHGIVNGIDEGRWRLPGLAYDGSDESPKAVKAKQKALKPWLKAWGWEASAETPTIGFRGRWDSQKGVIALTWALPRILDFARVTFVTWGKPDTTPELAHAWANLQHLAKSRPDRLKLNPEGLNTPEGTAEHYAASDFLIVPSRYEPCGLVQMECQRYGAIPIVRKTGGLADTVTEFGPEANGFLFDGLDNADDLIAAVERAVGAFREPEVRRRLIANTLAQRNAWATRVPEYEALYRQPIG